MRRASITLTLLVLAACGDPPSMGTDAADAPRPVDAPAGPGLARDVQPIFTARCAVRFCHDHATQANVLDLSEGAAHAALVDVRSQTAACGAFVRVRPGRPDESYLVWKLAGGGGGCLTGLRMPKNAPPLSEAETSVIRGWIAAGAPAN